MNRRAFLFARSAAMPVPVATVLSPRHFAASQDRLKVVRGEAEWCAMRTETAYPVMCGEAAERAGSGIVSTA